MGSINRGAAKVTTPEMGGNKLSVNYTALRFGKGWQGFKDNVDMHERFNGFAAKNPIGSVETSVDLMTAGKKVPAGKYSMFFTLSERGGWVLNLKPKEGDTVKWRMVLTDAPSESKCLKVSLNPSAEDGMCSLHIAFGKQHVMVPVMVAKKK